MQKATAESDKPCGKSECSMVIFLDRSMTIDVCPQKAKSPDRPPAYVLLALSAVGKHGLAPKMFFDTQAYQTKASSHHQSSCVVGRYIGCMAVSTFQGCGVGADVLGRHLRVRRKRGGIEQSPFTSAFILRNGFQSEIHRFMEKVATVQDACEAR